MRILIIKTSSMGDVIHTLPAITDLAHAYPNAQIDWVVEEGFTTLSHIHPAVDKVIPIALRRWRRNLNMRTLREIKVFIANLRQYKYDYVIDAQGLLKSAVLTRLVRLDKSSHAQSHGYDKYSIRGKYISWLYQRKYQISKQQHAVYRIKKLFSAIFNYTYSTKVDYGIDASKLVMDQSKTQQDPYLVFLHCTTWESKKWPVNYWQKLIQIVNHNGYKVRLSSGNQQELLQSHEIANIPGTDVLVMEPQSIDSLIQVLAHSSGVVCVDTGLGHLAAALKKPGVGLYGATDARLTSILAESFKNLQSQFECSPCLLRNCKFDNSQSSLAPCYIELNPELVWTSLEGLMVKG